MLSVDLTRQSNNELSGSSGTTSYVSIHSVRLAAVGFLQTPQWNGSPVTGSMLA